MPSSDRKVLHSPASTAATYCSSAISTVADLTCTFRVSDAAVSVVQTRSARNALAAQCNVGRRGGRTPACRVEAPLDGFAPWVRGRRAEGRRCTQEYVRHVFTTALSSALPVCAPRRALRPLRHSAPAPSRSPPPHPRSPRTTPDTPLPASARCRSYLPLSVPSLARAARCRRPPRPSSQPAPPERLATPPGRTPWRALPASPARRPRPTPATGRARSKRDPPLRARRTSWCATPGPIGPCRPSVRRLEIAKRSG